RSTPFGTRRQRQMCIRDSLGTVGADLAPDSRARGWIWAGSLTVATSTALLRVVSGEHFPSDVVAGAALGAAAGILIPLVHHEGGGSGDRPGSESPPAMLTVRFAF
ncbi:MAG: phosphatase PAP2 family protein, partial [Candidatus Eisenbacteria bacterium]|nr:phosphatase PAP2 family protein [Candidatus Eisenbacteria bacterium]